jgi:hypothetical protein
MAGLARHSGLEHCKFADRANYSEALGADTIDPSKVRVNRTFAPRPQRHAFGKIAGLINIFPLRCRRVTRELLQRHDVGDRREHAEVFWQANNEQALACADVRIRIGADK